MEKRNKIIEQFAIDFVENYFDEIDLKSTDWKVKSKEDAIRDIKKKDFMAGWVICEVMMWGTDINYIKPFIADDDGVFIIKIEDHYFKMEECDDYIFTEVFPKKVMVETLIFE